MNTLLVSVIFILALLIVAFGFCIGSGVVLKVKTFSDLFTDYLWIFTMTVLFYGLVTAGFALAKLFAKFNS